MAPPQRIEPGRVRLFAEWPLQIQFRTSRWGCFGLLRSGCVQVDPQSSNHCSARDTGTFMMFPRSCPHSSRRHLLSMTCDPGDWNLRSYLRILFSMVPLSSVVCLFSFYIYSDTQKVYCIVI